MRKIVALVLVLVLIPCIALADLTVYFLDVGQGDCAIIECDGKAMIIDGGLPGKSDHVYDFFTKHLAYEELLYMVATHPDNDHIGGLPGALNAAKKLNKTFKYIYSPVKEYDSVRFDDLRNAAKEQHLKIQIPYDEQTYELGHATVRFYNCGREKKNVVRRVIDRVKEWFLRDNPEEDQENNNMSLVVKITYGETAFLFTGDIEADAESSLINSSYDLHADVLKIPHHGSVKSSSSAFLEKVSPKYAVISCGEGNKFKHPDQRALDDIRRQDSEIKLYRTDLQGRITFRSDGHTITVNTERTAQSDLFTAPK